MTLAYDLPDEPLHKRTRELKRATFPPALTAMLVTIATAAAGAGAQLRSWPWQVHFTLGRVTLIVNFWALPRVPERAGQRRDTRRGLVEVDRLRAEQGLPPNEQACAKRYNRPSRVALCSEDAASRPTEDGDNHAPSDLERRRRRQTIY